MGTRSLSSPKLTVKLTASYQNLLDDGTSVVSITQPNLSYTPRLTNGVADNQVDRTWQFTDTLENEGQVTFDLYAMDGIDIGAGAGKDALGQDVVFQNVAAIYISNDNDPSDDGYLEIFPSVSHGWTPIGTHTVATGGALKGGGVMLKTQFCEGGFDVSPGVNNRITLKASGGEVTYTMIVLARELDSEESSNSSSESSQSSSSSSVSTSSSSVSTSSISTSSSSQSSWSSASTSSSSSNSSSSSSESSSSLSSISTSSSSWSS